MILEYFHWTYHFFIETRISWTRISARANNRDSKYLSLLVLISFRQKSWKITKLWHGQKYPRIARILMIQYAFWSSRRDLSSETYFVFSRKQMFQEIFRSENFLDRNSRSGVKLWSGQNYPRIARILMIQYAFWSSRRDLSFETHFVFSCFVCLLHAEARGWKNSIEVQCASMIF